jgi:hypothetical protein
MSVSSSFSFRFRRRFRFISVFPQDKVDADIRVVTLHLPDLSPSGEA